MDKQLLPLSSSSIDSNYRRKPRFQRQNSNSKCSCQSHSKNKSSCDNFSLSKFYVKKSSLKNSTPSNEKLNQIKTSVDLQKEQCQLKFDKLILDSTCIQIKNDSQILQESSIKNMFDKQYQNLHQKQQKNKDILSYIKEDENQILKKLIFYKEKSEKSFESIKLLKTENKMNTQKLKQIEQENIKLKRQIQKLIIIVNQCIGEESEEYAFGKKISNKNLLKLRKQYENFRQQQEVEKRVNFMAQIQLNRTIIVIKRQNQELRSDLNKQSQLLNLKLRMMQQKEQFLQKTLTFTKDSLNKLQRDYEEKQGQILESKRLKQIINQKTSELENIKTKYSNLIKAVRGQRKGNQNKNSMNLTNIKIPTSNAKRLSRNHSLEVKTMVYSHKQNDQNKIFQRQAIKSKEIEGRKNIFEQSFLVGLQDECTKIRAKERNGKQYRFEKRVHVERNKSGDGKNKQSNEYEMSSNEQLSLLSENSLRLSPQKQY